MLKKSIITIIFLSIVLSTCTSQDNRNNNQQSENVQLVPVSQAYDSCEELLGKEYNKFSLPKKISPKSYEHIYTLQCNVQENKVSENSIKEINKKFYNSSYDENKLINDQNGGIIYQEGDNASNYWGLDVSLMSPAYKFLEYKENENPIKEYFISDIQGDASFKFSEKEVNVDKQTDYINEYLSELLSPVYSDYTLVTKSMYTIEIDGTSRIQFICSENYCGIPFQYNHSEYTVVDNIGNMNYWLVSNISGEIDENDNFIFVNAGVPYTVVNKTEQDSIIPFTEAVKVLENELAENVHYDFTNVELMYCSFTKQPMFSYDQNADPEETEQKTKEYNEKLKTFEPMWCFEISTDTISTTKGYVKVNAITGEIFMDIK